MDEEQQGFRRNRGVDDVLQVSRRIAEEFCSSRGTDNVKLTLYDIEKAYPRINREALWSLLQKRGAPLPFLQVCKALHNHTQFHIKLDGVLSHTYEADRGPQRGLSVLSSTFKPLPSSSSTRLSCKAQKIRHSSRTHTWYTMENLR